MKYDTRKNILSTIIAGALIIFPVLALAGTGPDTNSWSEEFYVTVDWIGSTSSQIIYHFPASSTAPDQQYFVNYPVACWSTFNTSTITQDINGYWPDLTGSILANTCTGSLPVTSSAIIAATSGQALSFRFWPQETTAPTLNVAITSTPAHEVGYTPTSTRGSDWTTAYYDFDFLTLGSGSTSTEKSIHWVWPLLNSSATIANPSEYEFTLSGLDINSSTEYQVEIEIVYHPSAFNFLGTTSSLSITKFFEYSSWFYPTSSNYSSFKINNTHNLYQLGQISEYQAIVRLKQRINGINNRSEASEDNLFFISSNTSASSTEQINSYLTSPSVSSTINSMYQDCSWNDIACGLKNFAVWFFIPWDSSVNAIVEVLNGFKSVFPFNVFFLTTEYNGNEGWFAGDVLSQSKNTSDDLYFNINIAGQTSSIKVAGKTFLKDTFGLELTNLLFNIILFVFTLAWVSFVYQTVKSIKI